MDLLVSVLKEVKQEEKGRLGQVLFYWGGISLKEAKAKAKRFPESQLAEQLKECGVNLNE